MEAIELSSNPSSASMVNRCWLVCVVAIGDGGLVTGITSGNISSLVIPDSGVTLMDRLDWLDVLEGMMC